MPRTLFIPIWLLLCCLLACSESVEEKNSNPDPEIQTVTAEQKQNPNLRLEEFSSDSFYNVGFLIMDGVYNTEFTAPWDIFQHTIFREGIKPMKVFSVAEKAGPVRTFEGLNIEADFSYLEETPRIDILVVPSAEHHLDSDLENTQMIDFVSRTAQAAEFVTSHCDGAFVLAKAGALEGRVSTTFPSDIDKMRERFPDLDIRKEVLFVHDGKCLTSAGGAKSFEAALYLCEHLYGKEIAQQLAGGLVIDWDLSKVPHLIIPQSN